MDNRELSSKISKIDSEITFAVLDGHRPHDMDKFREHRRELVKLRCEYFGEDSPICKNERKNFR